MLDFVKIGNKITSYRKKIHMTQDELADKLFVTRQALSKWETGVGVPSVETILNLTKIFNVSFEEILCLNDETDIVINKEDIFCGHERTYIINKIINNELNINVEDVLYQMSPSERMLVLKAVKENKLNCKIINLYPKLTVSEQKYLKDFEITKNELKEENL